MGNSFHRAARIVNRRLLAASVLGAVGQALSEPLRLRPGGRLSVNPDRLSGTLARWKPRAHRLATEVQRMRAGPVMAGSARL
ncbi:MAG TPA: hypothetical protein VND98_05615 [Solirubrobacterales bacterium]|nr:hypothetical protein [Solirubrobacterales bacterium]